MLTKIDKEILSLDPDIVLPRTLARLKWNRSSLSYHAKANLPEKKEPRLPPLWVHRPQLRPPLEMARSFRPPRYFMKGALEYDRKRNPAPIPYLLIETQEMARARPIPSPLLRSLCKGRGILRRNRQGLVYLDIDNYFINALSPYFKTQGLARAPYFNLLGTPEGAHVPVILSRESSLHFLGEIREIGQEFTFEIEGLYSVEPTLWPEVEEVWFFKLRSPELEALRRSSFLVAKPGGHSFHITVGVKPRPTLKRSPLPLPLMRINIAYLAA